jgi:hypothetical protein
MTRYVLEPDMVDELTKELGHTFDIIVANKSNVSSAISPELFLEMDYVPAKSRMLLYIDDSMHACIQHYSMLKNKFPLIDACFVYARKFKSPWRKWLNTLPYTHVFVKARKNSQGLKLSTPLEVHRDKPRCGSFSAFTDSPSELKMLFLGEIAGVPCKIALDTAATHSFVSNDLVSRMGRKRSHKNVLDVTLGNGQTVHTHGVFSAALRIQNFHGKHQFHSLDLMTNFDVILGNDWLTRYAAKLDFVASTCEIKKGNRKISFRSLSFSKIHDPSSQSAQVKPSKSVLTALQAKRLARKGARLFMVFVKNADDKLELKGSDSPDIVNLIAEFPDVFKDIPPGLPPDRPGIAHTIPMEPGAKPVYKPLYRLSPIEHREVEAYIREALSNDWIEPSASPWGAPILFVAKKGGGLRMCIDYRALNKQTIKNRYPLPRIDDLFDCLSGAKYFTSLDLASGYHQIRIPEEDRPKTAFRTPIGHYQYKVLSFGLTNAPATFQAAMNAMFQPLLRKGVLVYLDDILIYSKTWEEHLSLLRQVLTKLQDNKYYCRLWKCHFGESEVEYLGHLVSEDGVRMNPDTVRPLFDWPIPKSPTDVRSFLGLAGYFRKFIQGYSVMVSPLTDLTQAKKSWTWDENTMFAFEYLKYQLTRVPVLKLPDMSKPFEVITDASMFGAGAVLLQEGHPVAFESKKFTPAERNYTTTEQEMLATYFALRKWRCYLEGNDFVLVTDHAPNTFFESQPTLSRRQARWNEFFQRFRFRWEYRPGRTNIADPLSRIPPRLACLVRVDRTSRLLAMCTRKRKRANDDPGTDQTVAVVNDTATSPLQTDSSRSRALVQRGSAALPEPTDLEQKLMLGYSEDPWFRNPKNLRQLQKHKGLWWYKKRPTAVVVPDLKDIKLRILREAHDAPYSGHCGSFRTLEAVKPHYWWPRIKDEVESYVQSCLSCQRNKSMTLAPAGLLQPIEKPAIPWQQIGMDFITGLPTTEDGFNSILVFVDHATKMVHFVPTTDTCDAPKFAEHFVNHVFKYHGLPATIISDRGSVFVSKYWRAVCDLLGTNHALSTAYHPQTGGQHERVNRVLEEMLRHYVSVNHLDWPKHLALTEFAINNAKSRSTGMTPFEANQGWHPRTPLGEEVHRQQLSDQVPAALAFVQNWQERLGVAKRAMQSAQDRQKALADQQRRDLTFHLGDEVMLSTKNITLQKGTGVKKLMPQWLGPFRVERVVSPLAYRLELPPSMKMHPVFHVSLLKPYHPSGRVQPPPPPLLLTSEDGEIFHVEAILDHRRKKHRGRYRNEYLVSWKGYGPEHNLWEPEENLQGSKNLIKEYHRAVDRINRAQPRR